MKNGSTANTGTTQQLEAGGGGGPTPPASRILYYYHPDYLGNVEYITDASGLPYQYFFYSPWGEGLVDQKASTGNWDSPYRFNGKELDEETGLYYYGARYYNPQVSVWLGVDALASKGPSITPYAFSHNNPVILVDPDGNWPDEPSENMGEQGPVCTTGNELQQVLANLPQQPSQNNTQSNQGQYTPDQLWDDFGESYVSLFVPQIESFANTLDKNQSSQEIENQLINFIGSFDYSQITSETNSNELELAALRVQDYQSPLKSLEIVFVPDLPAAPRNKLPNNFVLNPGITPPDDQWKRNLGGGSQSVNVGDRSFMFYTILRVKPFF